MGWRDDLGELVELISVVMACAPNKFPYRDYMPADSQMNLERAFSQIHDKFKKVADGCGETTNIVVCRLAFEEALEHYRNGDVVKGFLRTQNALHILMTL